MTGVSPSYNWHVQMCEDVQWNELVHKVLVPYPSGLLLAVDVPVH